MMRDHRLEARASRYFEGAGIALAVLVLSLAGANAQQPQGGQPPAQSSPREASPIDLTGNWVAIVNEDWRWRMMTPPKGDYASVPLNPEGRKVADTWQPAMDGRCEAYGAAALMRMPTRLRVAWENDSILKVETDAGQQTRQFHFSKPAQTPARTLQGVSTAEWQLAGGGGRGQPPGPAPGGGNAPAGAGRAGGAPRTGTLKVVTTNLLAGWLRKNGVPYSENAIVTEYYDRFRDPVGSEWLVVTTIVTDPTYLQQDFVTSSHFKREPDGSKWSPAPCRTT